MIETAIILVNYNTPFNMLRNCLLSLYSKDILKDNKIILVDNNSTNKSDVRILKKEFPKVDFIFSPENNGFGGGNNMGIDYAVKKYNPRFCYFLNTDTIVTNSFLANAIKCINRTPLCGIVGSNQLDFNKEFRVAAGDIKFLNVKYHTDYNKSDFVTWVSGAGFLIRTEVLLGIGGFDEVYNPAYYEETALEKECINNGYHIMFCHDSIIFHKGGGSTNFDSDYLFNIFHRNRIIYFVRYYSYLYFFPRFLYDTYKAFRSKRLKLLFKAYREGLKVL